jgi:hypothetical protein
MYIYIPSVAINRRPALLSGVNSFFSPVGQWGRKNSACLHGRGPGMGYSVLSGLGWWFGWAGEYRVG